MSDVRTLFCSLRQDSSSGEAVPASWCQIMGRTSHLLRENCEKPLRSWTKRRSTGKEFSKDFNGSLTHLAPRTTGESPHHGGVPAPRGSPRTTGESPHHGGVFEAMIRCAKRALTSVMGRADLRDEELLTAFVEAEGMLNSRPLAALSDDPQDEAVLTPNHFLVGRMDPPFAIEVLASQSTAVSPRQRWKVVQQQVNCIWRRWQKELVALLNSRKKWLKPQKNLKEDDLVLVIEDNIPRNAWSLGRVIETHPGADGLVRVVNVKVGSKVRRRAVQRLVPLSSRKSED